MSLRTKKAIEESFRNLIKVKPLAKMSIKEITDGCNVSRMTFYYHFADIQDLARYVSEQDAKRSASQSNGDCKSYLSSIISSFANDKNVFYNIYNPIDSKMAFKYLSKSFENVVEVIIVENSKDKKLVNTTNEFLSQYILNAIVGYVFNWINDQMSTPVDVVVDGLYNLSVRLINASTETV